MADIGGVYLNFGLWGIALVPAWLVVKHIGVGLGDRKVEREKADDAGVDGVVAVQPGVVAKL